MKTQATRDPTTTRPRVSLEQKVKLLVRKARAAERRRKHESKPPCRSELCGMRTWLLMFGFLAAFIFSFGAQAMTPRLTFEQANAAFAAGDFRAAIQEYEAILEQDGFSAPILFNLGNACYRDGQFGAAILNYERAQVLAPHDRAIAANLRLARKKAGVPAPALSEVEKAARALGPNTLAWGGSIALAVVCLAVGVGRFLPRSSRAETKTITGVAAVMLLLVATAFAIRWPEFHRAIVVGMKVQARITPASTAAESFALKSGEPVTVAKAYGQFILVRTLDGRSGWVSEKEIGTVFKAASNSFGRGSPIHSINVQPSGE